MSFHFLISQQDSSWKLFVPAFSLSLPNPFQVAMGQSWIQNHMCCPSPQVLLARGKRVYPCGNTYNTTSMGHLVVLIDVLKKSDVFIELSLNFLQCNLCYYKNQIICPQIELTIHKMCILHSLSSPLPPVHPQILLCQESSHV